MDQVKIEQRKQELKKEINKTNEEILDLITECEFQGINLAELRKSVENKDIDREVWYL